MSLASKSGTTSKRQQHANEKTRRTFAELTTKTRNSWSCSLKLPASEVVSTSDALEDYGRYVTRWLFDNGYGELLRCQGSTLRQWLSNLNAMHDYVKRSFPGDKFIAPVFWCEDCEKVEGSILLHYYSLRGSLLTPLVVGIVEELASHHFDLQVKFDCLAVQGEPGATFTFWRVSAVDESQRWKLSPSVASSHEVEPTVDFEDVSIPSTSKCPFSGRNLRGKISHTDKGKTTPSKCPFHHRHHHLASEGHNHTTPPSLPNRSLSASSLLLPVKELECSSQSETEETCFSDSEETCSVASSLQNSNADGSSFDFKLQNLNELFPFHILVDKHFSILNVGEELPRLLKKSVDQIEGSHIGDVVQITRPVLGTSWDWKSLNKLSDQNFFLTPISKPSTLKKKVSMADSIAKFQASMYRLSSNQVLFTLAPYARNVEDLNLMGLTLSDLPLFGCQRDAVFLGEHVAKESSRAHKLDKLSKRLANEKDLSNTLLYNMLPKTVAEDLRRGKTVAPAFHDNVTLFFSDVVGFTSMCDEVEPWDVIDMMNKLYTVMDFLTSHFDLYKVETVGDSYMCCSGLPEPDEYHAEKVANFALAVLECVKHVKSPVDGSPVQLRIGMHTGSYTSGVVGTLTPHYALFGDMVNFTSRHESTSVSGKIQCSSVLHDRLVHFSNVESSQYVFKPRGLVDMKGKGECYTYWLESGTESNSAASTIALASLSKQVEEMLATNSWKKRSYFAYGGQLRGAVNTTTVSSDGRMLIDGISTQSVTSRSCSFLNDDESTICSRFAEFFDDADVPIAMPFIDTTLLVKRQDNHQWSSLGEELSKSSEESEKAILDYLSHSLELCILKTGSRRVTIQEQLRQFVSSIAKAYESNSKSLHEVSDLLLRTNYIWEARASNGSKAPYALGTNPWDHFVLLFSAVIHEIKHTGSSNSKLEDEQHFIAKMYEGLHSCQQRRSVDFAFSLLEEKFEDLYEEINFGCPNFRNLVRKTVLCTDLENEATVHSMLHKCEQLNSLTNADECQARRRNEANIGLILAIATVAPFAQSQDRFLQFSRKHYEPSINDSSEEDWDRWYYNQRIFLNDILLPIIEEVLWVLPKATYLEEGATRNMAFWETKGKEWLVACQVKRTQLQLSMEDNNVSKFDSDKLLAANFDVLEGLLAEVVMKSFDESDLSSQTNMSSSKSALGVHELWPKIRSELRDFAKAVEAGYVNNRFHNFLHASHVAHFAHRLIKAAHSKENRSSPNVVVKNPLAHFAIVLSALVHDVGHVRVPNGQLAKEQPELADKYNNKSIAEQNSIDTAWELLMSSKFKNLQRCLFTTMNERGRFGQLLVDCVMATDIFDQDLRAQRKASWDKFFPPDGSSNSGESEEESYDKATVVMEHIVQAADVAHAMQDWEIYREWNQRLFQEMYEAYTQGRATKDPSDGWYEGELWFFDNWVIPLAQNLKLCGNLDITSDQLLKQAQSNRQRWQLEGRKICEQLLSEVKLEGSSLASSGSPELTESGSASSFLASQMVTEVESLSKVMARYERKYETALGSLGSLVFRGQDGEALDLSSRSCHDLHEYFRRQEWYQFHLEQGQVVATAVAK